MNISNVTAARSSPSIVPYLQALLNRFNLYATLLVLVPGLFLNILTFLVFLRKKFWKRTTMGFFFSVSSILSVGCCAIGILSFLPAAFNH
jgi:hypothetical protein